MLGSIWGPGYDALLHRSWLGPSRGKCPAQPGRLGRMNRGWIFLSKKSMFSGSMSDHPREVTPAAEGLTELTRRSRVGTDVAAQHGMPRAKGLCPGSFSSARGPALACRRPADGTPAEVAHAPAQGTGWGDANPAPMAAAAVSRGCAAGAPFLHETPAQAVRHPRRARCDGSAMGSEVAGRSGRRNPKSVLRCAHNDARG